MHTKNRTRGPDGDDGDWRKLAETVAPLGRRRRHGAAAAAVEPPDAPPEGEAGEAPAPPRAPSPRPAASRPAPADLDQRSFGGISRADARRIKSGKARIEGRIDLHGMTLAEAEQSLRRFVAAAAGSGSRTVLVVTGKGRGGKGVIRENLPMWLRQPPLGEQVLAYCRAQPRDGGSGAYYVRLRGG